MGYKLTEEQSRALQRERRGLCDYFAALTGLFEKEHPGLRLKWSFTIDAQPRGRPASQGLIEGRVVHHVNDGAHQAAVIIEIFNREAGHVGLRNLTDMQSYAVTYSEDKEPNTWHWIERV